MSELESLIAKKINEAIDKVISIRTAQNLSPAQDPNVDLLKTGKDITEYLGMCWNSFKSAYNRGEFGNAAWSVEKKYYFRKSLFKKPEVL